MQQKTALAIRSVIAASDERLAYLSKLSAWNVLLQLVLRLPSSVLIQQNCVRSLGCFLPVTMA